MEYPYKNAIFIIVSKHNIKAITYSEFKEGKNIQADGVNLEEFLVFDLSKELVWKYRRYAESFFDGVE